MCRILVLAPSGFGKTTSWAGREKLGIKGLDPKETYVIQCVGRGVPNPNYKLCPSAEVKDITKGNRVNVESLTGLECLRVCRYFRNIPRIKFSINYNFSFS